MKPDEMERRKTLFLVAKELSTAHMPLRRLHLHTDLAFASFCGGGFASSSKVGIICSSARDEIATINAGSSRP